MDSAKKKNNKNVKDNILQFVMNYKALFVLILLMVVVTLMTDSFLTARNLTSLLKQICMSSIIGVGFTLVLGSGQIDLSVGYMLGTIGMIMAKVAVAGAPVWMVFTIGLLMGVICGLLNAGLVTLFKLPAFIVTIATSLIFEGTTLLISGSNAVNGLPDALIYVGQGYVGPIPFPVIIMVVMIVLMYIIINKTKFGRHAIAIGGNEQAARVCGVNVKKVQNGVYILMGLCVAVAAIIMDGRTASAQPSAGAGMDMDAVAAVVMGGTPLMGGKANIIGTIIGCLIVGVISNGLNLMNVDSNWQFVAKGLIILLAIALDSQGTILLDKIRLKKSM